jgi:hypothetical protein
VDPGSRAMVVGGQLGFQRCGGALVGERYMVLVWRLFVSSDMCNVLALKLLLCEALCLPA